MVSFRKLFPALAVAGLLLTATASAQISGCSVSGVNQTVRSEGLTELAGTVFITCNTVQSGAVNAFVTLTTDGPSITNKIDSDDPPVATGAGAPQLLVYTGGQAGPPVVLGSSTVVTDAKLKAANRLEWENVSINPSGTGLNIRIDNVRVNANTVAAGAPIRFTVSITALSGQQSTTVLNETVTVATVQQGMTFAVTPLVATLQQCNAVNETLPPVADTLTTTTTDVDSKGINNAMLKFTPGFPSAFKTLVGEGAGAATGTRLIARFYNVPDKAKVFVYSQNFTTTGYGVELKAISQGGDPAPNAAHWQEVKASSTGVFSATWEVTSIAGSPSDPILIPVVIQTKAGEPAPGTLQVNGNFAPTSNATAASTDAAIPRFADVNSAVRTDIITIIPCSTTLLFPYVTSVAPWETGISISNTTKDVQRAGGAYLFTGTRTALPSQTGTCTLNYFPAGSADTTPTAQTTAAIAAGNSSVFLVGGGSVQGDAGVVAVPNFSGYIVANCNFQFAHGFAFMTSGSANQGGVGYQALVIPGGRTTVNGVEALGQ